MKYSRVASRGSIRLAFLIAALIDLDIISCDLETVYHNATRFGSKVESNGMSAMT
jgi:hypothetical protein